MAVKKPHHVRKDNLQKLLVSMNSFVLDAVDKEISKRFKIIVDSMEEDITKTTLSVIMKQPEQLNMSLFNEGVQPYIKHYIFMMKRNRARMLKQKHG